MAQELAERQSWAEALVLGGARTLARVRGPIIFANILVSTSLTLIGLRGMMLSNRGLGIEQEWAALLWVVGLVSFFLIPLEICVLKPGNNRK